MSTWRETPGARWATTSTAMWPRSPNTSVAAKRLSHTNMYWAVTVVQGLGAPRTWRVKTCQTTTTTSTENSAMHSTLRAESSP